MAPSPVMPKNWSDFLRVNENKTELFGFQSHVAVRLSVGEGKEPYATDEIEESSAVLLSHVWPTLPHVHKRRLTVDYVCMWKMLYKRV